MTAEPDDSTWVEASGAPGGPDLTSEAAPMHVVDERSGSGAE